MSDIDAEGDPDVALDIPVVIIRNGRVEHQWIMPEIRLRHEREGCGAMLSTTAKEVRLSILNHNPHLNLLDMEDSSRLVICNGNDRIIVDDAASMIEEEYSGPLFDEASLAVVEDGTPVERIVQDHQNAWKH